MKRLLAALALLLWPALASAQSPVKICVPSYNATTGAQSCQEVNGNFPLPAVVTAPTGLPLPTANIGPETITGTSLPFVNGAPLTRFVDDFSTGTLNTSTKWNRSIAGGGGNATTATNAVGATVIGSGNAANGWSVLQSQTVFLDHNPGYLFYQSNLNVITPGTLNSVEFWGFGTVPTTAGVPSGLTTASYCNNCVGFEINTDGKLRAVTWASNGRTVIADLSVAQGSTAVAQAQAGAFTAGCSCTPQLTDTSSYKYVIVFRGDNIEWYIEQAGTGKLLLVAYTTRGALGPDVNQLPILFVTVAGPTPPTVSSTIQVNQATVGDSGKNPAPGFDRTAYPSQTLTAANDAIGVNAMGAATCSFTVSANTNVALVFEATDPNATTWVNVTGYPWAGGAGITTVSSGTTGAWYVPCGGYNQVRMRVSSVGATPTATVTAAASTAANGPDAAFAIALGQTTKSASVPVTIASDQGNIPIAGAVGQVPVRQFPVATALTEGGITPVVGGSASSSLVLKASAGNLYSVYAECSAACWLMVFNATAAPSNGATTAGIASGNLVECIPIASGGTGGVNYGQGPPEIFTVGMTAAISSTTCATLTLSAVGFIHGMVQ